MDAGDVDHGRRGRRGAASRPALPHPLHRDRSRRHARRAGHGASRARLQQVDPSRRSPRAASARSTISSRSRRPAARERSSAARSSRAAPPALRRRVRICGQPWGRAPQLASSHMSDALLLHLIRPGARRAGGPARPLPRTRGRRARPVPLLDLLDPERRLLGVTPRGPLDLPPGGAHWYAVHEIGHPDPDLRGHVRAGVRWLDGVLATRVSPRPGAARGLLAGCRHDLRGRARRGSAPTRRPHRALRLHADGARLLDRARPPFPASRSGTVLSIR